MSHDTRIPCCATCGRPLPMLPEPARKHFACLLEMVKDLTAAVDRTAPNPDPRVAEICRLIVPSLEEVRLALDAVLPCYFEAPPGDIETLALGLKCTLEMLDEKRAELAQIAELARVYALTPLGDEITDEQIG
jgi:hypothetical protein